MLGTSFRRRVFVVGGEITKFIGKGHPDFIHTKHPEFGKKTNPILEDYIQSAVKNTIHSLKVDPHLIDKGWIGNFAGELFSKQGHLGPVVVGAEPLLKYKPIFRTEAACASGGVAFLSAVDSIQGGYDICLVVGAEVQTSVSARKGGDFLARASDYKNQRSLDDFTFPALFARRIREYFKEFPHNKRADLAHLSLKAHMNARKNPLAHMNHSDLTFEIASTTNERNPEFLSNPELAPYLRVSDCSQVSDGAAACIIASEDGLKKLNKKFSDVIEVLAVVHTTGNLFEPTDPLRLDVAKRAAMVAYQQLNLKPEQIEYAEVHDCFSIAEVLMYEALGFAKEGQGLNLAISGTTQIEGKIPVNAGGGLMGFGHPVGATGVKQVLEIFRQMKGLCGKYQLSTQPDVGLSANMGGDDKTAVVSIFQNLD